MIRILQIDMQYITADMIEALLDKAMPGEQRVFEWEYLKNVTREQERQKAAKLTPEDLAREAGELPVNFISNVCVDIYYGK